MMKYLKNEKEIISNWNSDTSHPLVSICCVTYNHEKYLEETLRGFLKQETNFPFEILIHDDASTDHTVEIIKRFEKEYPNIITAICQSENQYSKGRMIRPRFLYPIVKGEFIALCEGDDFWTHPKKLEMQASELKNNSSLTLVHTDVGHLVSLSRDFDRICMGVNKTFQRKVPNGNMKMQAWFSFNVFTCSMMLKKSVADEILSSGMIESGAASGDFATFLFAAQRGEICYLDEVTAIYRKNENSVTNKDYRNFIEFALGKRKFMKFALDYFEVDHEVQRKVLRLANKQIHDAVLRYGNSYDLTKEEVRNSESYASFVILFLSKVCGYEKVYKWKLRFKRLVKVLIYYRPTS